MKINLITSSSFSWFFIRKIGPGLLCYKIVNFYPTMAGHTSKMSTVFPEVTSELVELCCGLKGGYIAKIFLVSED